MSFKQKYYSEKEFDVLIEYVSEYLKDYNGKKQGIDVRDCSFINPEILVFSDNSGESAFCSIGLGANEMNTENEEKKYSEIVAYSSCGVKKGSREFETILNEITGLCNYPFEYNTVLSNGHIVKLSEEFSDCFNYSHVLLFQIFEPLYTEERKINFLLFIPIYKKEAEWIRINKDGYMRFIRKYMNSFDLNENDMARIDIQRDCILPDALA